MGRGRTRHKHRFASAVTGWAPTHGQPRQLGDTLNTLRWCSGLEIVQLSHVYLLAKLRSCEAMIMAHQHVLRRNDIPCVYATSMNICSINTFSGGMTYRACMRHHRLNHRQRLATPWKVVMLRLFRLTPLQRIVLQGHLRVLHQR